MDFQFFKQFDLDQFTIVIALHLKTQRFARGFVGFLDFFRQFGIDEFTVPIALHLKTQLFTGGVGGICYFLGPGCPMPRHDTHGRAFEPPACAGHAALDGTQVQVYRPSENTQYL